VNTIAESTLSPRKAVCSRSCIRSLNLPADSALPSGLTVAHPSRLCLSVSVAVVQVEYAIEAIKLGSTSIGVQTSEGVVLAVEKRITSKLLEPSSVKKIVRLDHHIGCAMSGLVADARTLVEHARVETQNHWFVYDEKMGVEACVQGVCDLALGFGEGEMVRIEHAHAKRTRLSEALNGQG
jgi:hypothetical protein